MSTWLVIGGWAARPEVLAPVFGPEADYLDVNQLTTELVDGERLKPDWAGIARRWIAERATGDLSIAGWSTGALIAHAVAGELRPRRAVFMSATPCFCRSEAWRLGWRLSVLAKMRKRLVTDVAGTVRDFHAACGVASGSLPAGDYSAASLDAGLVFLEHCSLLPVRGIAVQSIFIHGRDDRIVPIAAGRAFAAIAGAPLAACSGGHLFFHDHADEVRTMIGHRLVG